MTVVLLLMPSRYLCGMPPRQRWLTAHLWNSTLSRSKPGYHDGSASSGCMRLEMTVSALAAHSSLATQPSWRGYMSASEP
ncbi:hypothetical protein FB567DRAFT_527788 [Paraphoma chrysanthemicola]|uniref:Uncharacterized protein n=1 Tax=Paraphoma chrysanthemicola TaxID=798071 RepID=A0A8K0VYG1_9PLEO|nr:hypothetical protein FB567DRAFT_527788 [Paraphoma chrysanthemicola]